MVGIAVNKNSIDVPTVQTGCLKVEFRSAYPINLYGIINQNEYRESINRINRAISSNRVSFILAIVLGLCLVSGMTFIIIGAATHDNSNIPEFPLLTGIGIAVFAGGPIFALIGFCIIECRRVARMRHVIAEESMKYSSRSPIPCSWRLEITRHCLGGYEDDQNSRLVYHLMIDIGHSNQVATESTLLFGRQDNHSPPPYTA